MGLLRQLCYLAAIITVISSAPDEEEVKSLPGLEFQVNFKHFSGYLKGEKDKNLHYWLTEASDPDKKPLVLWLNGGPGCSSLGGLLTELGPFHLNDDGTKLVENEYAWNKIANVLFLESPACVGFSYDTNKNCTVNDDMAATSNYMALLDFVNKFPEYKDRDFYITGESYGGIYIPTLATLVVENKDKLPLKFKAYAIGNALSDYIFNQQSVILFGNYHGLFSSQLWDSILDNCCHDMGHSKKLTPVMCNFYNITTMSEKCMESVNEATMIIDGSDLNAYNLYGDCKHPSDSGVSRYTFDYNNMMGSFNHKNPRIDPPCTDESAARKYLNDPKVREALHIPSHVQDWDICSAIPYERQYISMSKHHKFLTRHVKGMLYNGDVDMVCNFIGEQWFVDILGMPVTKKRDFWMFEDQVGGFYQEYTNMTLVTVRGSGHMVPQDKPGPALKMIDAFINNKSL